MCQKHRFEVINIVSIWITSTSKHIIMFSIIFLCGINIFATCEHFSLGMYKALPLQMRCMCKKSPVAICNVVDHISAAEVVHACTSSCALW